MNAPLRFFDDDELERRGLPLAISPHLRLLTADLSRADSATKARVLSLIMPSKDTIQAAARRLWPNRSRHDAWTIAFTGELTHLFNDIAKQQFPELQFADGQVAPFITDVPLGKKTYEYHLLKYAGSAAVLNSYAWRTLPRITVAGDLMTGRVHRFGCCWVITEDDELANKHTQIDLPTELGVGAKRAHHERWDRDFAFGNGPMDLTGFLNHPNTPVIDAPLNAGNTSTLWKNKTAEEIVSDIKILLRYLPSITNEIEKPKRVLMSPDAMTELTTRKMSLSSDTTILEFLQKAFRGVTFMENNSCAASASFGNLATDCLFAYTPNDKTRVGHVVVEPFRQREPMQDGLEKVVICTSGHGATLWRQPYSGVRMDGVSQS